MSGSIKDCGMTLCKSWSVVLPVCGTEACLTVVLYVAWIFRWGSNWVNLAMVAKGEQRALPLEWRHWPQHETEALGVMLYLILLLYRESYSSSQVHLLQFSLKSWVYSHVWDSELWRELDELQECFDDDLSGSCLHYMNIWKQTIHLINSFSKSAFISKSRNLFDVTRDKEMAYFKFICHMFATLGLNDKILSASSPSSKDS